MQSTLNPPDNDAVWRQLAPLLDDALAELGETDRAALVLRYFENQTVGEIAGALRLTESAAQKRVTRALEKLRAICVKRGVTLTATAIAGAVTANAVQAAPAGLALTVTAAAAKGAVVAASVTALVNGTLKTIAMTTIQKTLIGAAFVAAVGTGIFEARQVSQLREQNQTLQQQQAPLAEQILQLQHERDEAANRLARLTDELAKANSNSSELLKLRGEITRLRAESRELGQLKSTANDPTETIAKDWLNQVKQLHQHLDQAPDKQIPELQFLTKKDWFNAANDADLTTEDGVRNALSDLRKIAKGKFASMMSEALRNYTDNHNGQLPTTVLELKPYFSSPIEGAILQRYQMLQEGKLTDARGTYLVNEIAPVDAGYDTRYYISTSGYMGAGVDTYSPTNIINKKFPPLSK